MKTLRWFVVGLLVLGVVLWMRGPVVDFYVADRHFMEDSRRFEAAKLVGDRAMMEVAHEACKGHNQETLDAHTNTVKHLLIAFLPCVMGLTALRRIERRLRDG